VWDDLLRQNRKVRVRRPVWVYGSTNGRAWNRPVQSSDLRLLKRIESEPIREFIPKIAIPWGDLYRSGYHEGITHLHHFYTRRNLIVFSALWAQVQEHPREVREALRFWLLSYNASHATIMTRVVAKMNQKDLVVTSAQPGVLYVSGLPVEKNIFKGLRRKLKTIGQAFEITYGKEGRIEIQNSSCLSTGLADKSVDYVFTDPPFGGNIPYAEVNFVNEAWLGKTTDFTDEVTVSRHQGKTVNDYQFLLYHAFQEVYRVLKCDAQATVVFHSTSARVWNALRAACEDAGFSVTSASVLDKTQGSFKQVTTQGAVRGDPLILLSKNQKRRARTSSTLSIIVDDLIKQAFLSKDCAEMSPQRIFSRLVGHYMARHQEVPISAKDFYSIFEEKRKKHGILDL
jgi:predicted RNA methylase